MNCFSHPNEPAVTQCKQCGNGMCKECADKAVVFDGNILCDSCAYELAQSFSKERKKLIAKYSVLAIYCSILLIFGCSLLSTVDGSSSFLGLWIVIGVFALPLTIYNRFQNWRAGRSSNGTTVVAVSLYDSFVYTIMKFFMSCLVTLFVGPIALAIGLYKSIRNLIEAKKCGQYSREILAKIQK